MTGLDLGQFKHGTVKPVVLGLGLPGDATARINLMTAIALMESGLVYKRQIGGPALGLWQMEPATHDDGWNNFLFHRQALGGDVLAYLPARFSGQPIGNADPALVEDDFYACATAAVRFYRSPIALPAAGDAAGMNRAWRLGYNTTLGAGSIDAAHTALCQTAITA